MDDLIQTDPKLFQLIGKLNEFTESIINSNHLKILQFIFCKNYDGGLSWAVENNLFDIVKLFIAYGATNHKDRFTTSEHPLLISIDKQFYDITKYLVENDADINANDDYALRQCACIGNLEMVDFLLKNGADIHARNDDALRESVLNGHIIVVKLKKVPI